MANVIMQHTGPDIGDNWVYDDGTVITDGVPNPNAVITTYQGIKRVDFTGNGIIDANQVPNLGSIKVTRVPGWQGNLGYRVVLQDWAAGATPNAIALAIYSQPNGEGYQYTTGAMLWDATNEEWYCTCPSGFEPGQNDIHMGFLYGAKRISAFTMLAEHNEWLFSGGGDWA